MSAWIDGAVSCDDMGQDVDDLEEGCCYVYSVSLRRQSYWPLHRELPRRRQARARPGNHLPALPHLHRPVQEVEGADRAQQPGVQREDGGQ
eukprot:94197-Hanusia_phi.AAC.1